MHTISAVFMVPCIKAARQTPTVIRFRQTEDDSKKKEILLWCHDPEVEVNTAVKNRKRKVTDDDEKLAPKAKSRSRFVNAYEKRMEEVEEAYQTLEKNHGNSWTPRAWANMYQMKKHTSLDVPPSGRFLVRRPIKCHLRLRMRDALILVNCLNLSMALKLLILPRPYHQLRGWHYAHSV